MDTLVLDRASDNRRNGTLRLRPAWVLVAVFVGLTSCQPQRGGADEQFRGARLLVVQGKYQEATAALEKFLEQKPADKNASRAGLFLFKAYLAQGQFADATKWCDWTIRNHPDSPEAHKCRYKLAVLAMIQGRQDDAKKRFAEIAAKPDGPLAAEAGAMRDFLERVQIREPAAAPPAAAQPVEAG